MPALRTFTTMPRPNDPRILRRIYKATRSGHAITTAGTLAGLGETVAWDWLRQGTEQLRAGDEHGSHAKFARVVNMAEAQRVQAMLDAVDAAGESPAKGWVPMMTREQRRRKDEWGIDQAEPVAPAVVINLYDHLPPGAAEALHALAQAEVGRAQKFLPPGGGTEPQSPNSDQA